MLPSTTARKGPLLARRSSDQYNPENKENGQKKKENSVDPKSGSSPSEAPSFPTEAMIRGQVSPASTAGSRWLNPAGVEIRHVHLGLCI